MAGGHPRITCLLTEIVLMTSNASATPSCAGASLYMPPSVAVGSRTGIQPLHGVHDVSGRCYFFVSLSRWMGVCIVYGLMTVGLLRMLIIPLPIEFGCLSFRVSCGVRTDCLRNTEGRRGGSLQTPGSRSPPSRRDLGSLRPSPSYEHGGCGRRTTSEVSPVCCTL